MLQLKNVSFSYNDIELLKNISFSVNNGECVCLVGPNGCGKTTLLKCVIGKLKIHGGNLIIERGIRIGYLKQETFIQNVSMINYLFSAFKELFNIKMELDSDVSDSWEYSNLISRYIELGGYELEMKIERIIRNFGFENEDLEKGIEKFSQGQKRLIELIRLNLEDPDLYVLDEPTNHLDISMRIHLENFVQEEKSNGKSFLIVSHDRTFIDRIADKTIYIQRGFSIEVEGGYSAMLKHLEHEVYSREKHAKELRRKITQLEKEVLQRKNWAKTAEHRKKHAKVVFQSKYSKIDRGYLGTKSEKLAKRAAATQRRTERMIEKLKKEKPFIEKKLNLSFENYSVANRLVFRLENVSKSFGEKIVLNSISFQANTKDRIGVIGSNGCGKTTLLRCIVGELRADSGKIYRNDNVNWLYIPQNIQQFFKKATLIENMSGVRDETTIRQFLGAAKIRKDKAIQPIENLSYGELMRATIVYAILNKVEFLIMDEPTNHLDIESLEILDKLLEEFPGGMLFVSHDRTFIAKNAERIFKIENGNLLLI